ncbi:hypothetical protein [Aliiglaciecola lipolytica]|uniref:Uncharacterized protein n=1 Tax=Aliiglaciecola lipolytica E3 TaxID=1127673 RepID=K6YYP5_9ALTE|nr:hypothetical protein [Aliiglaciecola lipolytica]GAC16320.1 hypothetical protein GLIP_3709 [Aliiglaciecola lipolytica E3]
MQKTVWYKAPEMIIALSALLISVVTAVVGIYSAYIDRSYARAAVWPRIEIYRSFNNGVFEYGVMNSGNGPALIQYAHVTYKGEPIQYWNQIPDIPDFVQSHLSTRILSSQNTIIPLSIGTEKAAGFVAVDSDIDIQLCYCSIYEECWLISRVNAAETVESCEISPEKSFLQ